MPHAVILVIVGRRESEYADAVQAGGAKHCKRREASDGEQQGPRGAYSGSEAYTEPSTHATCPQAKVSQLTLPFLLALLACG